MEEGDSRAYELVKEGDKKCKPDFLSKMIWGIPYEEAADCYTKAANLFKTGKKCEDNFPLAVLFIHFLTICPFKCRDRGSRGVL